MKKIFLRLKILMLLLLCISIFCYTTLSVAKANPLISIGANVLKSSVRTMVGSTIVKQGVRTAEKTALKKAEERWFSRLAKDQVLAIEKAAARAEPVAGKKGWLKTVIGAGLWLTGIDIVFDLYDVLSGGGDVESYTDSPLPTDRVLGAYGLYAERIKYPEPNSTSYFTLKSFYDPDFYWHFGAGTRNSSVGAMVMKSSEYPYLQFKKDTGGLTVTGTYMTGPTPVFPGGDRSLLPSNRSTYKSVYIYDTWGVTDSSAGYRVQSNDYPFDYARPPAPSYVPNPYPDIWPNDKQGVEIYFPDPATVNDPEQAVIEDIDYITNPQPGTNPDPEPGGEDGGEKPDDKWPESLGEAITTRFPFSLPWDLYGLISLLAADPQTPVFEVDSTYMGMPVRFKYSLDFLDPYMPWFRGLVLVGFCVFLVQSTRNLLGGAK